MTSLFQFSVACSYIIYSRKHFTKFPQNVAAEWLALLIRIMKFQIQSSAWILATLIYVLRCFPKSLQANAGIVP
jgi:hypothetical protein